MAEEFQGGVCGGTWWNHNLFSGGGGVVGGFSSPCSVAQLGGGYDMGGFGWPNEIILKGKANDTQVFDTNNNSLFFPTDDMDSTLDILGFGLSPTSSTTDWNICKSGSDEENYESLIQENMINPSNFIPSKNMNNLHQNESPPMATLTTSSNSSGDSSTLTCEGGLTSNFAMSSSASYLIQSLFDDDDSQLQQQQQQQQQQHISQQPMAQVLNPNNFNSMNSSNHELMSSPCSWVESSIIHSQPPLQSQQCDKFNGGTTLIDSVFVDGGQVSNSQYNNTAAALSNIRASLLNSLQSRSRAPYKQKSNNSSTLSTKRNHEEPRQDTKNNIKNNDQLTPKRPRIETPSSLPTFKVRKEKLGDRITALQQLVSPFGKTDTASVLHEAIEYIRFLHDQVHVLTTPYLKNGAPVQQQQQVLDNKMKDNNEETNEQELRSRGLCLVPISSTYPVAQETPVDFWTPTFGGTTFR